VLDKVYKKRVFLANRLKDGSGLTARGQKAACDLKVALMFGKKPEPQGTGDREGERGKEAASGESRMRRTFWKGPSAEAGGEPQGEP